MLQWQSDRNRATLVTQWIISRGAHGGVDRRASGNIAERWRREACLGRTGKLESALARRVAPAAFRAADWRTATSRTVIGAQAIGL